MKRTPLLLAVLVLASSAGFANTNTNANGAGARLDRFTVSSGGGVASQASGAVLSLSVACVYSPDQATNAASACLAIGFQAPLVLAGTPAPTPTPDLTASPTPPMTPTIVATATASATPTPPATPVPTPPEGPIRALIESFYQLVLGRDPEPGAVDAWHYGYFNYAVSFGIDVRFVPREMARIFFFSEEYAARNRTDEEFLADCYQVFLVRPPNIVEIGDWMRAPDWNRREVVTIFAESEEFAARIQAMYPGYEGDASRNFVAFMYIGLLDRLVDKEGLEYASALFDAAYAEQAFVAQPPPAVRTASDIVAQSPSAVAIDALDAIQESDPGGGAGATRKRSGIEAVRAQAKQMAREVIASEEFLGKAPASSDCVARFYRAFLGRFPSNPEVAYWSGQLDSGAQSTDDLIDLFADSQEFSMRLQTFLRP